MVVALLSALVLSWVAVPFPQHIQTSARDSVALADSLARVEYVAQARIWGLGGAAVEPHSMPPEAAFPGLRQSGSDALGSLDYRSVSTAAAFADPGLSASTRHRGRVLRGLPPDSLMALRVGIVSGAVAATVGGLFLYQRNAWWAAEHRGSFHFHSDGGYSQHLDKVGHFHGTFLQSQVLARSLSWSGFSHNEAALGGAIGAWLLQLHVEIHDGFNELWGFDVYDVLANTLGAGWFYSRERLPGLDPFVLKFSYWPSEYVLENNSKPGGQVTPPLIDDYLGHTYWLSLRVHDLLPDLAKPVWPDWLMLAAGVGGERLYTPEAQRTYFLALDLDLERILPVNTWLAATGLEALNFLKLPLPAVRLHPRPMFFLAYYGQSSR